MEKTSLREDFLKLNSEEFRNHLREGGIQFSNVGNNIKENEKQN